MRWREPLRELPLALRRRQPPSQPYLPGRRDGTERPWPAVTDRPPGCGRGRAQELPVPVRPAPGARRESRSHLSPRPALPLQTAPRQRYRDSSALSPIGPRLPAAINCDGRYRCSTSVCLQAKRKRAVAVPLVVVFLALVLHSGSFTAEGKRVDAGLHRHRGLRIGQCALDRDALQGFEVY